MLAGGQVIRRWARKLLELPETGEGTAGFEFKVGTSSLPACQIHSIYAAARLEHIMQQV
jgi:hypothetical protein